MVMNIMSDSTHFGNANFPEHISLTQPSYQKLETSLLSFLNIHGLILRIVNERLSARIDLCNSSIESLLYTVYFTVNNVTIAYVQNYMCMCACITTGSAFIFYSVIVVG